MSALTSQDPEGRDTKRGGNKRARKGVKASEEMTPEERNPQETVKGIRR
jgi:hypothetical protein